MATTSLWSIRGNVVKVINYIKNPKKTTLPAGILPEDVSADEETETVHVLVDAINCSVKNAAQDMNTLKEYFGKTGGITAYHGYQSFAPEDDITPIQAHDIGMELAQELWGGKYQVLVATHLDKDNHIHNHFVINTVPVDGGKKFCRTKQDYMDMRNYSDALCVKYDLSVCKTSGKGKNYGEYKAELEGNPTIRSTIRTDIDRAIAASGFNYDFFDNMKRLGYEVYLYNSKGEPLVHPKLKPFGTQKCFRFDKLGPGYDFPEIKERLRSPNRTYGRLFPPPPKKVRRSFRYHEPRSICSSYRYYGRFLSLQIKRPGYVRRIPYYLREDIAKIERFEEKRRFVSNRGLKSYEDVISYKAYLQEELSSLRKQKRDLYIRASKEEKLGNPGYAYIFRLSAKEKKEMMRDLRKEIRLCNDILSEYMEIREKCLELRILIVFEHEEQIRGLQRKRVR